MASLKRDHLIETAIDLFDRHGIHATGIDTILAESGVAKMTLYNHFRSKDALILAALRRRDEEFREWFMDAVVQRAETPEGLLLALFDALTGWFIQADFQGCCFVKAAAEYGDPDDPIHIAAAEHKRLMLTYVRQLAKAAGAPDWKQLGQQIFYLMEGATVAAQVSGDKKAAMKARAAAEKLVTASFGSKKSG